MSAGAEYYVFDTEAAFDAAELAIYNACIAHHAENWPDKQAGFAAGTVRWANKQTRETDGKYILPVCDLCNCDDGYTKETATSDWFPDPEGV
jgi:hypothetical protein